MMRPAMLGALDAVLLTEVLKEAAPKAPPPNPAPRKAPPPKVGNNVRLDTTALYPHEQRAADASYSAGGTPKDQLAAVRATCGAARRLSYKAHQGRKEMERRARQAAKRAAKGK